MAASGKYYLIAPGPRIFVFYTQQDATKYLFSKILFHRYSAYLIFSFQFQANVSQPLTVVTKNFSLDATDVLDLPLLRLLYDSR